MSNNTIQNTITNAAAEVKAGEVVPEVAAVEVEAACSEQTGTIQVQEECRSTDTSSDEVKTEVKSPTSATKMTPNPEVLKSIGAGSKAKAKGSICGTGFLLQHTKNPVLLPFSRLVISKWNPSAARARKDADIESLKKDIEKRGLINPISIVKVVKEGEGGTHFSVIAGAGRLAALKKLRGEGSGLQEGEYKIVSKLDESDEKCAGYSLAENAKRKNHSDLTMAIYMYNMTTEHSLTEGKLAKDNSTRRDRVNRLVKLGQHLDKLPPSWVSDLDFVESSGGKKVKKSMLPQISFAHWETVASLVGEKGKDPEVQKLLTDTYEGKWKVSKLRKELKTRFPEYKGKAKGRPGFGKKVGKDPEKGTDVTPAEVTQTEQVQVATGNSLALSDDELEILQKYRDSKKAA